MMAPPPFGMPLASRRGGSSRNAGTVPARLVTGGSRAPHGTMEGTSFVRGNCMSQGKKISSLCARYARSGACGCPDRREPEPDQRGLRQADECHALVRTRSVSACANSRYLESDAKRKSKIAVSAVNSITSVRPRIPVIIIVEYLYK